MAKRKKSSRTGKNKGQGRRQKITKPSNKSEQYASTPIEKIVRMTTTKEDIKELIKMVNTMRSGARARIKSIEKAGLYSYAGDKFAPSEKTVRELLKGKTPVEQRNILVQEFARYQAFFESKTSSKTGIAEIEREQDMRLFGVDEYGNPKRTLTREQRTKLWSLYSEYSLSNATTVGIYGSNRIQQLIADFVTEDSSSDFPYQKMFDFLGENMKEA